MPGSTAEGRETTFNATSDSPAKRPARRALRAEGDARDVGEGNRRDDFETLGIDDAEHRISGACLHDITRVVIALRDEAVEGRVHDGAGGDGFSGGACCLGLRDGGLRVRNLPLGVFHFLPRRHAALEEILRPRLVGGGVGERGLRPFHFRRLLLDFCGRARNLEAHEHVTALTRSPSPR